MPERIREMAAKPQAGPTKPRTMQAHVLGVVSDLIEQEGFTPVASYDYSNTGRLHAMDGLESVDQLKFAFHPTYMYLNGRRIEESDPERLRTVVDEFISNLNER